MCVTMSNLVVLRRAVQRLQLSRGDPLSCSPVRRWLKAIHSSNVSWPSPPSPSIKRGRSACASCIAVWCYNSQRPRRCCNVAVSIYPAALSSLQVAAATRKLCTQDRSLFICHANTHTQSHDSDARRFQSTTHMPTHSSETTYGIRCARNDPLLSSHVCTNWLSII